MEKKLYIAMVGLPATGKSTIAGKIREILSKDKIKVKIFNNGNLRRSSGYKNTHRPDFYDPGNLSAVRLREEFAMTNIMRAKRYLSGKGNIAVLDATNVSQKRRQRICSILQDHPVLFIECINEDEELLDASIQTKAGHPELRKLGKKRAIKVFKERISYYKSIYSKLSQERNRLRLDSLNKRIISGRCSDNIPFYERLRDIIVTDTIENLYLIRHGETHFNVQDRIGGDSSLTDKGISQAKRLGKAFSSKSIPFIFTSTKKRTIQTAEQIKRRQKSCRLIQLSEFDEIDAGRCEGLTYEEIRKSLPHIYHSRRSDKYNYIYPEGEGYVSMQKRVTRGIKKAIYLSNNAPKIMIVGHQAINRMILSHFLYRRKSDVPFIYIPQDKYYHIVNTYDKKLFRLVWYG